MDGIGWACLRCVLQNRFLPSQTTSLGGGCARLSRAEAGSVQSLRVMHFMLFSFPCFLDYLWRLGLTWAETGRAQLYYLIVFPFFSGRSLQEAAKVSRWLMQVGVSHPAFLLFYDFACLCFSAKSLEVAAQDLFRL